MNRTQQIRVDFADGQHFYCWAEDIVAVGVDDRILTSGTKEVMTTVYFRGGGTYQRWFDELDEARDFAVQILDQDLDPDPDED